MIGIFLDLSRAFDTIYHDILLSKLDYYGIWGIALEWIKNYLTSRKQFDSLRSYGPSYAHFVHQYKTFYCPHLFCYFSTGLLDLSVNGN